VRDLVAALEQVRRHLLLVIHALEGGDIEAAMGSLETASEEWRVTVEQLRSESNAPVAHLPVSTTGAQRNGG
jgi:hypothetical protein